MDILSNNNDEQLHAVFDLCQPDMEGLISLRRLQQLFEEHENASSSSTSSDQVPTEMLVAAKVIICGISDHIQKFILIFMMYNQWTIYFVLIYINYCLKDSPRIHPDEDQLISYDEFCRGVKSYFEPRQPHPDHETTMDDQNVITVEEEGEHIYAAKKDEIMSDKITAAHQICNKGKRIGK